MPARICVCPPHRVSWPVPKRRRMLFAPSGLPASQNLALVGGLIGHRSIGTPSDPHLGSWQTRAQPSRIARSFRCKAPHAPARQVGPTRYPSPKLLLFVYSLLRSGWLAGRPTDSSLQFQTSDGNNGGCGSAALAQGRLWYPLIPDQSGSRDQRGHERTHLRLLLAQSCRGVSISRRSLSANDAKAPFGPRGLPSSRNMLIETAGRFKYTGASRALSWAPPLLGCAPVQKPLRRPTERSSVPREELCTGRSRFRGTCAMRERRTAGWRAQWPPSAG
jgi:hypothetical protein